MLTTGEVKMVRESIANLDLEPIMVKLMDKEEGEGWTLEKVIEVAKIYRIFLDLQGHTHGHPIVPTKEIDRFWHQHILDTKKYMEDCDAIFGYYLHHFPYFGMRGVDDKRQMEEAFQQTKDRFLEYGIDLLTVGASWCVKGASIGADCGYNCTPSCGRCTSQGCQSGGHLLDETRPRLPESTA